MKQRVVILSLLLLLWAGATTGQSPYGEQRPLDLRITGMLIPVEEPQREDLVTVDITVQDKPMRLRVGKVEDLTTQERAQAVKHDVLLRQVRFTGPAPLMEQLQKPEMLRRTLTIEGWLEPKERRFLVTTVKESSDVAPSNQ